MPPEPEDFPGARGRNALQGMICVAAEAGVAPGLSSIRLPRLQEGVHRSRFRCVADGAASRGESGQSERADWPKGPWSQPECKTSSDSKNWERIGTVSE